MPALYFVGYDNLIDSMKHAYYTSRDEIWMQLNRSGDKELKTSVAKSFREIHLKTTPSAS